jgi:hypothetical protein
MIAAICSLTLDCAVVRRSQPGGIHIPAMLSPWVSLADLVAKFLSARERGPESLRVFVNTLVAEAWEDNGRAWSHAC